MATTEPQVSQILEKLFTSRTISVGTLRRLLESEPTIIREKLRLLERKQVVLWRERSAVELNPGFGTVLGIDLGSSHFRLGLADFRGEIVREVKQRITPEWTPQKTIDLMVDKIRLLLRSEKRGSLRAIGVGVPSPVDAEKTTVINGNNLGWTNIPLGKELQSALHVPTILEKDTSMAAMGEHWRGVARGVDDFAFVALGTGIGLSIFINGELYSGATGWAGEIYLMNLDWPKWNDDFGVSGHFESYASGQGIAARGRQALGVALKKSKDLTEERDAFYVFKAYRERDARARKVLEQAFTVLGVGLSNIVDVLDPKIIVLGGGVVWGAPRLLRAKVEKVLARFRPDPPAVRFSSLGELAQIHGAVLAALSVARRQIASQVADAE